MIYFNSEDEARKAIEAMINSDRNINTICNIAHSLKAQWTRPPVKPALRKDHTPEDVIAYHSQLVAYERDLTAHRLQIEKDTQHNAYLDAALDEICKEEIGFYTTVPEQYQRKVAYLAYERGHSGGQSEITNELRSLMGIFE